MVTEVSGDLKQWHRIGLTFDGPDVSEKGSPNPFTDFRLQVTFTAPSGERYEVPGFYAADGDAAHSGADSGNKWRVFFTPGESGEWSYSARLRTGPDLAIDLDPEAGQPAGFDGGTFQIGSTDKVPPDRRATGRLSYVGDHYLAYEGTGSPFLKGGADSPENFLAYRDFDQTHSMKGDFLHAYEPHVPDWREGDPTWGDGLGKGIIGALNYLSSKGVNSLYFLPYNLDGGDGEDVWPWVHPSERRRFDVSKLAQWEIVFSHMDAMGITLHVQTQETENDQALDGGELGTLRKLYYRELVARFSHHLGLIWNLGEENTNTTDQRKDFARFIRALDPYDHPIVLHTRPGEHEEVYGPLLGFDALDGISLQTGSGREETLEWVERSARAGHPWVVMYDEFGPASEGVKPDSVDPDHDDVREKRLWGTLMAGGAGVEWYFGYEFPNNDLNLEDFRSRDRMWDQTRHALTFFHRYLPFTEMAVSDGLTARQDDYVLARPGEVYAIYLPNGEETELDLEEADGDFDVLWYDPRNGGELQQGSTTSVVGPGIVSIGGPPEETGRDWVAIVRR